jgi:Cell wall-associated hydrolases (invasion-associated proteins)
MKMRLLIFPAVVLLFIIAGCNGVLPGFDKQVAKDSLRQDSLKSDSPLANDTGMIVLPNSPPIKDTLPGQVATGNIHPEAIVAFAESLMGTPYRYASTDPKVGFDCSGFITYVFNHFGIKVPRSSIDFTHVGKEIPIPQAKRGDIILFTGTDSTERFVGHMGIVITNPGEELQFIHSSSGRAHGVTVSPLKGYYMGRFLKVIRIFKQL